MIARALVLVPAIAAADPLVEPAPERVWSAGAVATNDVLWFRYDDNGAKINPRPAVGTVVGARQSFELDALGAVRVLPGLRVTALAGVQSFGMAWDDDCIQAQMQTGGCLDGATQHGLVGGGGLQYYHRWSDWEVHVDVRTRVRLPIGDADASTSLDFPKPSFQVAGGATTSLTVGIAHPVSGAGAAVLDLGYVLSVSDLDGDAFDRERYSGIVASIGYVLW